LEEAAILYSAARVVNRLEGKNPDGSVISCMGNVGELGFANEQSSLRVLCIFHIPYIQWLVCLKLVSKILA